MEDKTAKELVKSLDACTKELKKLTKLLSRKPQDPAQPEGTEKLRG